MIIRLTKATVDTILIDPWNSRIIMKTHCTLYGPSEWELPGAILSTLLALWHLARMNLRPFSQATNYTDSVKDSSKLSWTEQKRLWRPFGKGKIIIVVHKRRNKTKRLWWGMKIPMLLIAVSMFCHAEKYIHSSILPQKRWFFKYIYIHIDVIKNSQNWQQWKFFFGSSNIYYIV